MSEVTFTVGGHFENRKGPYEVVSVSGDRMVIRWDTGEQIETDIKGQRRVLRNMEREFQRSTGSPRKVCVPGFYGTLFTGMAETDFSEDVTGTHWRSREQLGGAVARLVAAPFPVDSWSIYHRPEVHWADRTRYPTRDAWLQAKLAAVASSTGLWAGFYVERSNKPDDDRSDWDRFINWLGTGGESVLAATVKEYGLVIRDRKVDTSGAFPGLIAAEDGRWHHRQHDGRLEPVPSLTEFLSGISRDRWIDLLIVRELPKADVLALGATLATDMGRLFTALLPLLEGSTAKTVR